MGTTSSANTAAAARESRRAVWWLGWIVATAAVLRLGWWVVAHPEPVSDYLGYRRIAARLFEHGVYERGGQVTAWRTPGYPLFLAAGMFVSQSDRWLSLLNVALSILAVPLVWWLAIRLRFGTSAALWCAAVVALMPTLWLWAPVLGSENLQVVVLLVAWSMACGAVDVRRAFAAGVVFGVAVLVRPESIIYVCAAPALIGIAVSDWRRKLRLCVPLVVGCALIVTPWYVRNEVVVGRGAGLSSTGGINFYLAHRGDGAGWVDTKTTPLRGLAEAAASRRGYRLGFATIEHRPWSLVTGALRQSYRLYRLPMYAATDSTRRHSRQPFQPSVSTNVERAARLAVVLGWIATAALFVIGIVTFANRRAHTRALTAILVLIAANWFCFTVVFWAIPRYRFAIEPLIGIVAGLTLEDIGRRGAFREYRRT